MTQMIFPKEIEKYISGLEYETCNIARTSNIVLLFGDNYSLKISKNIEEIRNEYEKNKWLSKRILSPKPICFCIEDGKAYYLREYLKGKTLIDEMYLNNPELIIDYLSKAISLLRKLDNENCPFENNESIGNKFVHGDLCLPNIIVNNNEVGFIDLDNAGIGDEWNDYAWLLWSLEYNLKTDKYNKLFLEKSNIEFNEDKYNQYIEEEYRLRLKKG